MHMAIPKLQEVVKASLLMDGGSICLYIVDDTGEHHSLEMVQHAFWINSTVRRKFGRLYLDDRLIGVRSSDETAILNFLETVRSVYEHEAKEVISFVRSKEYLELAHRYPDRKD